MKARLRCWLEEHPNQGWTDALPDITVAMNRQSHTSLGGKMPYEVFFNRTPRWESHIPIDQLSEVHQVENEELDMVNDILWKVHEKGQDGPSIDDCSSIDESSVDQVDNDVSTGGSVSYILNKFVLYGFTNIYN